MTNAMLIRCLVAMIFLAAAIWSGGRYADIAEANRLARPDDLHARAYLARAAPEGASALWLDAYSERLAESESTGARLRALDAARRAARADPSMTRVWNRIAWLNISLFGRLTSEAERALGVSFALTPYGPPELIYWRIGLADAVWSELSDPLRASFITQIEALRVNAYFRRQLLAQSRRSTNEDLAELLHKAAQDPHS